jgi:outer membrane PBP1 activator LpoA protein
MKTESSITVLAVAALSLLLGAGCKPAQEGSEGAPGPTREQKSLSESLDQAGETAKKAVADTSAQAEELITKAQNLVTQKNYEGAMNLLNELKSFKLTPEQEKLMQNLKATIQKALESKTVSEGTKALGDALGGQKP